MNDHIQSWVSIVVGAAVVVLVGWIALDQMGRPKTRTVKDSDAAAMVDAGSGVAALADSGAVALEPSDAGLSLFNSLMMDAGALPSGAPRSVKLGVVLVQFVGAEGAPSSARAKPDALKHAAELAEQAKTDWKAAVRAGDSGSAEDIGRIPRGVLDRATEIAVFSLATGDISEPLETPKGYWVVKRTE